MQNIQLVLLVAFLWGASAPFLNKSQELVAHITGSGIEKIITEKLYLATKPEVGWTLEYKA